MRALLPKHDGIFLRVAQCVNPQTLTDGHKRHQPQRLHQIQVRELVQAHEGLQGLQVQLLPVCKPARSQDKETPPGGEQLRSFVSFSPPLSQEAADGRLVQSFFLVEELGHRLGSSIQEAVFHQVLDALRPDGSRWLLEEGILESPSDVTTLGGRRVSFNQSFQAERFWQVTETMAEKHTSLATLAPYLLPLG